MKIPQQALLTTVGKGKKIKMIEEYIAELEILQSEGIPQLEMQTLHGYLLDNETYIAGGVKEYGGFGNLDSVFKALIGRDPKKICK